MAVNSGKLLKYKNKFKMILIVQVPHVNIDRITDTFIEKSTEFTITEYPIVLALTLPKLPHLRFDIPVNIKSGEIIYPTLDFNLVIIPNNLSAEQIRSLSDVERLGGKLLATGFDTLQFTVETKSG